MVVAIPRFGAPAFRLDSAHGADLSKPPAAAGALNPTVRNDYLKAVHAAMLQRFGVEQTRVFWAGHPLTRNGAALGERELALHLFDEGAKSPLDWAMTVVNSQEPFLLERGVDPRELRGDDAPLRQPWFVDTDACT